MYDNIWVGKNLSYKSSVCQYVGRKHFACAKCVEACPQKALRPGSKSIEIDPELCTDCGDCIAICPSGAITQRITSRQLIVDQLKNHKGAVLVICEQTSWDHSIKPDLAVEKHLPSGTEPILVENAGMLSENDFAQAIMTSRRAVVVLALGEDSKERPYARAAEFTEQITARLFARRLLYVFSDVKNFWARIPEIAESSECEHLPKTSSVPEGLEKRETFRFILSKWLSAANITTSHPLVIPHPSFATITCDDTKCILCGACANQCKVDALCIVPTGDKLIHTPIDCLNCGACVDVCPEKALSSDNGLHLDRSFLSRREIAQSSVLRCPECGRPFTTVKRSQKVSSILKTALGDDPIRQELLGLCPECRTKKAFFTYADWTAQKQSKR